MTELQLVEIYTDGACKGNPGPGGWAALLRTGDKEREISGGEAPTTNNRMPRRVLSARSLRKSAFMTNGAFTEILLGVLAILLVVAAVIDVRTFTISNRLNLTVAAIAPLYWWSVGLPLWPGVAIQIGLAVAVFALFSVAFFLGMMGGGDVKLAAALALWFSPLATARFLIFMSPWSWPS